MSLRQQVLLSLSPCPQRDEHGALKEFMLTCLKASREPRLSPSLRADVSALTSDVFIAAFACPYHPSSTCLRRFFAFLQPV
eukprot:1314195-Pleurochrysis_carterae.AAC.1